MKAIINSLTLALVEGFEGMDIKFAKEFATQFVEDNADLFVAKPAAPAGRPPRPTDLREPGQPLAEGELPRAVKHYVPVVGPDGLTDIQRAAVGGVGLCPNCQQPNNRHLPGCARASGEDRKAVTKTALPPVV
jgi:hypothetical protein